MYMISNLSMLPHRGAKGLSKKEQKALAKQQQKKGKKAKKGGAKKKGRDEVWDLSTAKGEQPSSLSCLRQQSQQEIRSSAACHLQVRQPYHILEASSTS